MTTGDDHEPAPATVAQDRTTDTSFLEFLVCPVTKESLSYAPDRNELISRGARLAYPIVDGIPMLATDAARELEDDE